MAEEKKKYVRKIDITGGLYDAYKYYKKNNPKSKVQLKDYNNICQLFNKIISDKIVRESFEFRMLGRLGSVRIKAKKVEIKIKDGRIDSNRMPIDWKSTKDMWDKLYGGHTKDCLPEGRKKVIVHTNENVNGYIMSWLWDKNKNRLTNKLVYKFKPVKGGISKEGYYYGKRGLAAWIKNDERTNEYYL